MHAYKLDFGFTPIDQIYAHASILIRVTYSQAAHSLSTHALTLAHFRPRSYTRPFPPTLKYRLEKTTPILAQSLGFKG